MHQSIAAVHISPLPRHWQEIYLHLNFLFFLLCPCHGAFAPFPLPRHWQEIYLHLNFPSLFYYVPAMGHLPLYKMLMPRGGGGGGGDMGTAGIDWWNKQWPVLTFSIFILSFVGSQFTGQPTIVFYASTIFEALGFQSGEKATLASLGIGLAKVWILAGR